MSGGDYVLDSFGVPVDWYKRRRRLPLSTYFDRVSKNVPSLTGYNFNTHQPIFYNIWHMLSADIQKSATGIIFSITSFYLIYVALKQQ